MNQYTAYKSNKLIGELQWTHDTGKLRKTMEWIYIYIEQTMQPKTGMAIQEINEYGAIIQKSLINQIGKLTKQLVKSKKM